MERLFSLGFATASELPQLYVSLVNSPQVVFGKMSQNAKLLASFTSENYADIYYQHHHHHMSKLLPFADISSKY